MGKYTEKTASGLPPQPSHLTYAGSSPSAEELDAGLVAVGDARYFIKGDSDPVYLAVRRSTSAGGAIDDFALTELT